MSKVAIAQHNTKANIIPDITPALPIYKPSKINIRLIREGLAPIALISPISLSFSVPNKIKFEVIFKDATNIIRESIINIITFFP